MVTSGAKKSSMVLDHCTGRSSIKESSNASQLITIADIGKHLQPLEISAPSHLATQHAIQLAKEVDPKAVHTAGVPTKIHVTHQCANALKILENNIDSATEDNNNSNNNLENSIEYTIDVTDALQCMAIHRSQSCGYRYIEIDDGFNKSVLEAFYNTYYDDNKFEDYIEETIFRN